MRFSLYIDTCTWLGWSNESGQVQLFGPPEILYRIRRAERNGLPIGGQRADTTTPWAAHRTMIGALRERTGHTGPIDFAGYDDDGLEITFIPEPDAETGDRDGEG